MVLETFVTTIPTAVLLIAITVGALWAFRKAYVKQIGEMQEKVIATYKEENAAQGKKIERLEQEVKLLNGRLTTLQVTLQKRRGLTIEFNDDLITLIDKTTGAEHVVKISTGQLDIIPKEP